MRRLFAVMELADDRRARGEAPPAPRPGALRLLGMTPEQNLHRFGRKR